MITYDIFCSIHEYKSLGLSQRQTATILSINRKTISRYWNMTFPEYETSQPLLERLYLKKEEIMNLSETQSPEKIADFLSKKYNIVASARSIRRLLSEWSFNKPHKFSDSSLYCGDCIEILNHFPSESIDLVVTDPPYRIVQGGCRIVEEPDEVAGILGKRMNKEQQIASAVKSGKIFKNNEIKFSTWIPEVFRILKNGTHFYCMSNGRNMKEIWDVAEKIGFRYVNTIVWNKGNATPNRYYMQAVEFILLFRKGDARSINRMGSKNVIDIPNIIGKKDHPTEKPSDLMQILIENSSDIGDIVCDPFMGIGSTGIACVKTGRKFIGIEIDENFYKIAHTKIFENKNRG